MYIMNIPCIMNIPRMYIIQTAPFKICLDIELNVNFLGRKYHIIPPSLYVVYIIYIILYKVHITTNCIHIIQGAFYHSLFIHHCILNIALGRRIVAIVETRIW